MFHSPHWLGTQGPFLLVPCSSNAFRALSITQLRLGPKTNYKIYHLPDPGRIRPKNNHILWNIAVRTLPRDPPGEGGTKNKIKNRLKHSQDYEQCL